MNKEIEARFLEINKRELIETLIALGAQDEGEKTLTEIIFYDAANTWAGQQRYVRLRSVGAKTELTYKQNKEQTIDSALEIEFSVSSAEQAEHFLKHIGLSAIRRQEKRRHTLTFQSVVIDIDTWPKIPTYVEFEGPSESAIRTVAEAAGFDWKDVVFDDARTIIQDRYHLPIDTFAWYTFERCE